MATCSSSDGRPAVDQINFKCINGDYSLLRLPMGGVRLYGVFDFQVLFGTVEVNGYIYHGKKFSAKNFVHACIPNYQVPLYVSSIPSPSTGDNDHMAVLTSRLRDLVEQPSQIASQFLQSVNGTHGVIVLRHKIDEASSFIAQQHTENIFSTPLRANVLPLGDRCFCLVNAVQPQELCQSYVYSRDECQRIYTILDRMQQGLTTQKSHNNRLLLIGNKGAGKSTLMRYLINSTLARTDLMPHRIFLLDSDVGQSELTPPGLISLHEITQPILSASFANQRSTFTESFFFGSNSPGVDFGLYVNLVNRCLKSYMAQAPSNSLLFVNTVGWIEELGHDLMCNLIRVIKPSILINVMRESIVNFEVPPNYGSITAQFMRHTPNSDANIPRKATSALLRSFLTAGYFGMCLSNRPKAPGTSNDELRLADVRPYCVYFNTIALYFHPELAPVADHLVFSALNCAVVALCSVDKDDKNFDRRKVNNDNEMPERISSKFIHDDSANKSNEQTDAMINMKRIAELPILRCCGYGLIRAIDLERRVFYVITPVDAAVLPSVNVFALGYELQTPGILFDHRSAENAPYLVELGKTLSRNHQKLFSPFRNVTGEKRMIGGRGGFNRFAGGPSLAQKRNATLLKQSIHRNQGPSNK